MVDHDDLALRSVPLPLGDRFVRGLHPDDRFIWACICADGARPPQLHQLRQVVLAAPRSRSTMASALEISAQWGATRTVLAAVRAAADVLPGVSPWLLERSVRSPDQPRRRRRGPGRVVEPDRLGSDRPDRSARRRSALGGWLTGRGRSATLRTVIDRYQITVAAVAVVAGALIAAIDHWARTIARPDAFTVRMIARSWAIAGLAGALIGGWLSPRSTPWWIAAVAVLLPADGGGVDRRAHPLGRSVPVLALVGLVGVWSAMPDTEPAVAVAFTLAPLTLLTC